MKKLSDGTEVAARTYYYLLDWNEVNQWEFMYKTFNKKRLCDLNIKEYNILFQKALSDDLKIIKQKINA